MTMSSLVIAIFLLSIGASFVQRTTGFGFGIFIMTMLPFFLPTYGEATTLSGLLAITTSAVIVWRLREYVTWKRLWPILTTFIVVSTIAIFALTRIEDHILRQILGVALILISIYFALFSQKIKLPTTKKVQAGAGTLSGLMGGFFGMQGPPAVLYFIQSEPTKEHYMAMTQTYFLIGNVMMTIVRAYNGFLTTTVLTDYLFGLGGVIIGTCLGAFVFKRIPNRIFRYIVYAYIAVSGVIILLSWLQTILEAPFVRMPICLRMSRLDAHPAIVVPPQNQALSCSKDNSHHQKQGSCFDEEWLPWPRM